jgi:NADH-quinone oxidoreductase subunit K
MENIPVEQSLLLAALLFGIGLVGVVVRKNMILMMMSVEIMLNAAGMAFIVAGSRWVQPDGQVMFIFILSMAAAEVAVGLALILKLFHLQKSINPDEMTLMNDTSETTDSN